MKVLQALKKKAGELSLWRGSIEGDTLKDVWWKNLGYPANYAGKTVNDDTVMEITALYSALRLISETIGTLPLKVYQRTDNPLERLPAPSHPLSNVLRYRPSYYETPVSFKEGLALSLCLWNQAYVLVSRAPGTQRIVSLKVIPSPSVQPKVLDGGQTVAYDVTREGRTVRYDFGDVIPIKGFGHVDDLEGLQIAGIHRNAFALALAAEEYAARFFSGDARPSGILKLDRQLTPEQRDTFREELQKRFMGTGNHHKFAIFEAGMEFQPISASNRDSQFLEARKFQVAEVARTMRVPLHMLYELDRATYANSEHNRQEFVDFTLRSYLVRIESAINAFLLGPVEQRKYYVQFDVRGLLRGDQASRGSFYTSLYNTGSISAAEIRALEDLPYREGSDVLRVPLNTVEADQADTVEGEDE